ncbi:MAG: tryptophan synthase subunit alpha [Bacillota bacterium]|nr:tryptophan synthase subunit alpha [Bacillota bacterium]
MGLERINKKFDKLKEEGKKAFIPYIMAGDGGMEKTEKLIYLLEGIGASVIELGAPFSDPVADGPTIQAADERSLSRGTNLKEILEFVEKIRHNTQIPIVIMGYLNPIMQFGISKFCDECSRVGVDGLIIPDLPYEEWSIIKDDVKKNNIALIPLVTPTSGAHRIKILSSEGTGYVYTVTVAGVTGSRREFNNDLYELLEEVKSISNIPVVAGFGISTKAHVQEIEKYCDGVVVGSKIVELAHINNFDEIKNIFG